MLRLEVRRPLILGFALLLVFLYFAGVPLVHFVACCVLNAIPIAGSILVVALFSCALAGLSLSLAGSRGRSRQAWGCAIAMAVILVVFAVVGYFIFNPNSARALAEHVVEVGEPVSVLATRFVPLRTAHAYALSELHLPTHTAYLRDSYLYYHNATPVYTWIVEPEGRLNRLTRNAHGIFIVYGSYPPDVVLVEKELWWSPHRARLSWTYLTLARELYLRKPHLTVIMNNTIPVLAGGEVYLLVPAVDWERGLMYSYPVLAGHFIVDSRGNIEYVEAEELGQHPLLKELREAGYRVPIVPEKVAREWIETYRWSKGWLAVVLYHETYEIRDVGGNPQPYLVLDENGHLWWLFVVEPAGESYAVKHIIYVDAESPEPRILVYTPDENWMGASRVLELVKSAHPEYNWDDFLLEEPIPAVVQGRLYWKVTIVTETGRGVVGIDLVDAETGKVHVIPVGDRITPEQFATIIRQILAGSWPEHPDSSIQERIGSILERIAEIQRELQELQKQLEELQEQLAGTQGNG